jgi:hypothetical protein
MQLEWKKRDTYTEFFMGTRVVTGNTQTWRITLKWILVKHSEVLLNELYFWTLSIVWCLKKKLRNKIYISKNHNTHVQNSHKGQLLTTEPLTWVHTQHKPLKQVRHRWQQMTQPLHTSQLLKPSRPGRFTTRERTPGTHWIGVWVGPRTVLDAVVKRKIPSPLRESNSRTPVVQPVAQRYTD